MKVIANDQNMIDLVLQQYGSAERVVVLCSDNGLGLDDDIASGQELFIDETITFETNKPAAPGILTPNKRKRLVNENENAIDLALFECNSVEALIDLCQGNGLALDDDISAGAELTIKPEWKRKRVPPPVPPAIVKKKVMHEYDNIVDAALAIYGNAESLVGLCTLNALMIDEDIAAGQLLIDSSITYRTTGRISTPVKTVFNSRVMVIENQNLVDATLQYYGSVEKLLLLCEENLMDVNSSLQASMILSVAPPLDKNKTITDQLQRKHININTGTVDNIGKFILLEDVDYVLTEETQRIPLE